MHLKLVQFLTFTLVYLSFVLLCLLLITKSHHNIVKVLWIYEHELQASEQCTRKFDNVMTWRQFAFYYNKSFEKRISKKTFYFKKKKNYNRTRLQYGHLGDMPWCLHHTDGRIN